MDTGKLKNLYFIEKSRLNSLCEKWQKVLENGTKNSDDTEGAILSVLGQSHLLLNNKLKKFEQMLCNIEEISTEKPILESDLQGYWENVMIQVNDVYTKFAELENEILPITEIKQGGQKDSN